MKFFDWSESDGAPATFDMSDARQWDVLLERYTDGRGNRPLERIFEIQRSHGVRSVLIETRYIDADWRSEHARFYSTTFTRYASVAHRLHFFAAQLPTNLGDLSTVSGSYRGYAVLRPLPSQPVGRTMVTPPPELEGAMRCEAVESVDVLGWRMTVRSMPFISQDAQYLRCAHADLWMTLRHAYLRHQIGRKLPSDIHDATMGGVVAGRQVPSDGLSIQQMLVGMNALGLSPATLPLPKTAAEKSSGEILSLFGIMCRYVNSNITPLWHLKNMFG